MFNKYNEYPDIFEESFTSAQRGFWVFGGVMVALAILIFMFPALIGFLFAGLMLFIGVVALVLGYHFWKFRKQYRDLERGADDFTLNIDPMEDDYHFRRFTMMRW